jgi:hypothetical protein
MSLPARKPPSGYLLVRASNNIMVGISTHSPSSACSMAATPGSGPTKDARNAASIAGREKDTRQTQRVQEWEG